MEEGGQGIEALKDRLWDLGYPKLCQKIFTSDGLEELCDDVPVTSCMDLLLVMMTCCPSDGKFLSACSKNRVSDVEKLLQKGQDPSTRDPDRQKSALHAAASKGHAQVVQLLVRARANLEARDSHGSTALHMAARQRGLRHWLCHWSVAGQHYKTLTGIAELQLSYRFVWKSYSYSSVEALYPHTNSTDPVIRS